MDCYTKRRVEKHMGQFHIDVTELYWIDGSLDAPEDLCLHGHAVAYIGSEKLEYDCTISATALYLLKTLTENHVINEDNQMLPCCGHFYIPDEKLENVTISGCDNGIDWTVEHIGDDVVITLEDGTAVTVPLEEYRLEVYQFVDKIEAYYQSCSPKKYQKMNLITMDILHFGMSGIDVERTKSLLCLNT